MNHAAHNNLVSFIWSIADDCLRDVYVRGKYRDAILPMVVLRRLDSLLEPTKDKALEEVRFQMEDMGETELDEVGLRDASGYVFYNTSKWTLKKLFDTATNNQQILLANVEEYLNGFGNKEIRVELSLQRSSKDGIKFLFGQLISHKEEIEQAFGNELTWLCLDDCKSSRIQFGKEGGSNNDELWPQWTQWLIDEIATG
ncbi:MAG: DUF4268 domain-containing protein [Pseudomonadales bacterium]|nr:DUF4268 domain-containing protein [Pseudomonadales bacterium]